MGGTFMSLPEDYRDYFIRNLHDALSGHRSNSVCEAVAYGEHSRTKCIGITIETRPDYCLPRHLDDMLSYGCTRLEIGVQSTYEDVARDTNRGHTVSAIMINYTILLYTVPPGCCRLRLLSYIKGHGLQSSHTHDAELAQCLSGKGFGAG